MTEQQPTTANSQTPSGQPQSQTETETPRRTHRGGRHNSIYTPELAAKIIAVVESDVPDYARAINANHELPPFAVISRWIDGDVKAAKDDHFGDQFQRAVRARVRRRFAETDQIVDECMPEKGHVALADLRVRQRTYLAQKLDPIFQQAEKGGVSVTVNNQVLGLDSTAAIDYLRRRGKIYLPEDRRALIEAPVEAIGVEAVPADEKQPETK